MRAVFQISEVRLLILIKNVLYFAEVTKFIVEVYSYILSLFHCLRLVYCITNLTVFYVALLLTEVHPEEDKQHKLQL